MQRASELLDHRRLSRASHREISHDNHQASQGLVLQNALPVKEVAELRKKTENERKRVKKGPQDRSPLAASAIVDDIDGKLDEVVPVSLEA